MKLILAEVLPFPRDEASWLHRVAAPLAVIAAEPGSAIERLHRWFQQLMALKRQKVLDDPEMFATSSAIAEEAREVVQAHVAELVEQLTQIIDSGISTGEFKAINSVSSSHPCCRMEQSRN